MNRLIQFITQIPETIRKRTTRFFILCGIAMAYSPYWISLFIKHEGAREVANEIVSFGWVVLALGLLFYSINLWLDVKQEKEST